ncbi:hypothetical protein BRADI_1g71925v3 [Brachypodium distachyon]|uniref:Uncharacterized protein n=1 Tax=Brachypodium distachyon TaxID=15368 RepID=A0A2K2DUQ3_BRADI|nr:hypothetical protein BRADI_1g71925v3 [Brachypodium distachyon]
MDRQFPLPQWSCQRIQFNPGVIFSIAATINCGLVPDSVRSHFLNCQQRVIERACDDFFFFGSSPSGFLKLVIL